jgi:hypothetical protein
VKAKTIRPDLRDSLFSSCVVFERGPEYHKLGGVQLGYKRYWLWLGYHAQQILSISH